MICLVGFLIYSTAKEVSNCFVSVLCDVLIHDQTVPVVAVVVFLLITEMIPLLLMILMVHGDSLSSPLHLNFWLFCFKRPDFRYHLCDHTASFHL
jgi:hypothetical protein